MWESNPPPAGATDGATGFEDRGSHQATCASTPADVPLQLRFVQSPFGVIGCRQPPWYRLESRRAARVDRSMGRRHLFIGEPVRMGDDRNIPLSRMHPNTIAQTFTSLYDREVVRSLERLH